MSGRALILSLFVAGASVSQAADLYRSEIQPLFARSCLGCHNPKVKQGGFDLSTREALLAGSEHGKVVVPGNPEGSQLYKLVAHISDPGMPFKAKKLPEDAIAKIADWIRAGAPFGDSAEDADAAFAAEAQKHWAFRKPGRPAIPSVANADWSRNPVDAFLAAEHAKRNLTPLAEANRETLIRRAYLDLTGLVPPDHEVRAFVADKNPKAYEALIDRLLASPQYGEQWGRHWLDIWRYSDWYGYRKSGQVRYSQRHIWRWRDWTVQSINENKSYAQMILEMLAGDELAPSDARTLAATGYLARNWYMFNRNVWLQDTVEYTSTAFLGITLKCARCHNHKYDPIPQTDYYRFRAFFEPIEVRTDRVPGEADVLKDGLPRVYDADESKPTYRFVRGNEANPDTTVNLQAGVPVLFGKVALPSKQVALPVEAYFPDGRSFVPADLLAQAKAEISKAETELRKAKEKPEPQPIIAAAEKKLEAAKASLPALNARIAADLAAMSTPVPQNVEELAAAARKLELESNRLKAEAQLILGQYEFELAKSDPKKLASATGKLEAAVKALKEPAEGYTPIGPKFPVHSSGRRLALAQWIASKDNPLTARVAMNHIWLRHFGKPLVPTVFNFGRSGKAPTHPELLDWLAVEFMERGWDMKAMHRLLMTSRAYRMQSSAWAPDAPQAKADPDNTWLWRMNTRRMDAENVRDSLLALAGKLDNTMGGPEIEETKGQDVYRRSIYFRHTPDLQMEMLRVFDAASPIECFQRSESIVPQQALALANSKLSQSMAEEIAKSLPAARFVDSVFLRVLGRMPSAEERKVSEAFLVEQAAHYRGEPQPAADPLARARQSLVHVLFNHNDFVTIR
ncbi:MAG: PSD1 domain-containing protein [Acidobacteria bacterium]|nr:PSD1 domain-containing protein [Acidobacteriota bacterium]